MYDLITFIQHEVTARVIRQGKHKRHSNQKGRRKIVNVADDIIFYIENRKQSIKDCQNLINKFSKLIRYNISMQKQILFLYANSELSKKDLNKTTPFKIAKKKTKTKNNTQE